MTKYTYENVLAALEAAVAEKGADYVYPYAGNGSCRYTEVNNAPSCIVGHVVAKLDAGTLQKIHDLEYSGLQDFLNDPFYEGIDASDFEPNSFPATSIVGDFDLTEDDLSWELLWALQAAQGAQDQGDTWGTALQAFKDEYVNQVENREILEGAN